LKDAFKREYPDMIEDALRKAANEATTMTSPTENKPWSLTDPQDKFVERAGDNPNEPPAKDAVIKENDWEKRVKSYDDKASRRDGGQEQPAGSMAAAGMGGYPSGAAMQMSSFGSGPDTFAQDALARGGDKDMEDPEIAQEESDAMWISDNICPKCSGNIYVNEDKDLNCRMCGTIIVLTVRRKYDSRTGKIRDNKKEARGRDMDGDIEVDRGRVRDSDSSHNRPTLVRQRGFQRRRGRPRRTLGVDRG
jgi:hypothetical protein